MVETLEIKEKRKKQQRKYWENHKDNINKWKRDYYKEYFLDETKRLHRQELQKINRQKESYKIKRWQYELKPTCIYKHLIRHHKQVDFTMEEFIKWYSSQRKICYYCDLSEENINLFDWKTNGRVKRLTLDRRNNNRGYELNNLVLACYLCNAVKNNVFTEQEMLEIGERYIKPKWQHLIKGCEVNV